jgi:hypothetical protein
MTRSSFEGNEIRTSRTGDSQVTSHVHAEALNAMSNLKTMAALRSANGTAYTNNDGFQIVDSKNSSQIENSGQPQTNQTDKAQTEKKGLDRAPAQDTDGRPRTIGGASSESKLAGGGGERGARTDVQPVKPVQPNPTTAM